MDTQQSITTDFDHLVAYAKEELAHGIRQDVIIATFQDNNIDTLTINRVMHAAFERPAEEPAHEEPDDSLLSQDVPVPSFIRSMTLFSGRIGRRGYWLGQLYCLILVLSTIGPIYLYATAYKSSLIEQSSIIYIIIAIAIIYIPLSFILQLSLIVRRMHDMERINSKDPLTYYVFSRFLIMFGAGDPGNNTHGAPNRSSNPLIILGIKKPLK